MKVSLNWLNEYVKIDDLQVSEIADKLTLSGLEVEGIIEFKRIDNLVTAKVLSKDKHENADKLSVCKVTDGSAEYQIVCGAPNVDVNQIVVLAKIGAVLPEITIKESKIRDVISQGMLCSFKELGIDDNTEGIAVLNSDVEIGIDANDILHLGDTVLELNVTPNRPDCLSMIGVAREVSALFKRELKLPKRELSTSSLSKLDLPINVNDVDACPVYVGRVISGIKVTSSPSWLSARLRSAGLKSINNVVDITNFILLECNQPLHAFDSSFIKDKIVVRKAVDKEKCVTLDKVERELSVDNLVIADSEKVIAVAGVMGSDISSVTDATTEIFLECAYFEPTVIRKSAKLLQLSTDASYRYERGIDAFAVESILDYASMLIAEITGGSVSDKKLGGQFKELGKVEVVTDPKYVNKILGTDISVDAMLEFLNLLDIKSELVDGKIKSISPTYRIDINREADIAEEIGRLYGYNNIETTIPTVAIDNKPLDGVTEMSRDMRIKLEALGFNEAINFSFLGEDYLNLFEKDDKYVRLLNPISQDMAVMRRSIFPSLIKNLESNWNQFERSIKLFEISSVFENIKGEKLPLENRHLSIAMMGLPTGVSWIKGDKIELFYYLKGVVENIFSTYNLKLSFKKLDDVEYLHSGRAAAVYIGDKRIGFIGEVHPMLIDTIGLKDRVIIAEFDLDIIVDIHSGIKRSYSKFSKYQVSERDLSMLISKSVTADEISKSAKSASSLIVDVNIFDIYLGKELGDDLKSVAFRIKFLDETKTLSDEEIATELQNVVDRLTLDHLAKLR